MALECGATSAFAMFRAIDEGLTRYSNNAVENSTRKFEPSLYLRAIVGNRMALCSSDHLDSQRLSSLAALAVDLAKNSPEIPRLPPMAETDGAQPVVASFDGATACLPASRRAEMIRHAFEAGKMYPTIRLCGNAVSGAEERAIANSNGVLRYFAGSWARFQVTALADSGAAGMARAMGRSTKAIDPQTIAKSALDKAASYDTFTDAPPGEYEVVLEPSAAAETLFHLGYLGFGAAGHLQGNSCFAGMLGQKALADNITITDDPLHPDVLCEPFDWEGVPRQRTALVSKGAVLSAVYDLATARKAGLRSTGHGLPPEGAWFCEGPYPSHMVLTAGVSSRDDLISHVRRGLLVTSFHYTRPIDPKRAVITGMTRNGTFLIENGRVVGMTPNLRFAVSAIDLLANVEEIGNDSCLAGDYNWMLAPSIRTRGFQVTGKTNS